MRDWRLNDLLPTLQEFGYWKVGSATSIRKSKQALFLNWKPSEFVRNIWIYFLLILLLGVLGKRLYSQTKPTVSEATSQQAKIADSLYALAKKYDTVNDYRQAILSFERSLENYRITGNYKRVGDCYSNIGSDYYFLGDLSKALLYTEKALAAYRKAKSTKDISGAFNNLAGVYYGLGNYPRAIEYLKQAAVIEEKIGDKKVIATVTENIGAIYSKLKEYNSAAKYINKAYAIFKEIDNRHGIAKMLIEMGYISMEHGYFDQAFSEFDQALQIVNKENNRLVRVEVLLNLGMLYYKKSDFKTALSYYNLSLKDAKEIKDLRHIGEIQINIGNTFRQLGDNWEANVRCETALKIAEKTGAVNIKKDACECLYQSYKSLKKPQSALTYYEKARMYEDSLQMQETSNKAMNMEFQKQQLVDSIAFVKQQSAAQLKHQTEIQAKEKQRNIIIFSLGIMLLVAVGLWSRLNFVRKSKEALKLEKDRSEALLLNILPEEIAEELKATGSVKAKDFGLVSILFTDFKSFTQTAEKMSPQRLVEEINVCFEAFDRISDKYQIEKIKTIGDAYMAAGGMANADENTPKNVVLAGLEMQAFIAQRALENHQTQKPYFEMRLGIHAGPIVAGIVGVKKFQYDIWGDTVNTASRMESNGAVGKVNISEAFYELIKDDPRFSFEYRGNISAKGKGEINMYFVEKNGSSFTS